MKIELYFTLDVSIVSEQDIFAIRLTYLIDYIILCVQKENIVFDKTHCRYTGKTD